MRFMDVLHADLVLQKMVSPLVPLTVRQNGIVIKIFNHKHQQLGCCIRRQRSNVWAKAAPDGEAVPSLYGDWREFRAKLIADQGLPGKGDWAQRVSEENQRLLQLQNPRLAAEELWAHDTTHPERGGLLLATLNAPKVLNTDKFWQAVVLLVQHDASGSVGLILNRPSGLRMGVGKGGLPFAVIGAPAGMQELFADSRVYCGGMVRQDVFHVVHGHNLEGAMEVVPGVFVGGEAAAVNAVRDGLIPAGDFKFFSGAMVWTRDELQREIDQGAWYTAAASRPMLLKQCLQLPKPLWKEILECMGGEYANVAEKADQHEF